MLGPKPSRSTNCLSRVSYLRFSGRFRSSGAFHLTDTTRNIASPQAREFDAARRWDMRAKRPALWIAALGFALAGSTGCQTWYGGMTLPSGRYLQHYPQYFAPDPQHPLPRELATRKTPKGRRAARVASASGPRRSLRSHQSPSRHPASAAYHSARDDNQHESSKARSIREFADGPGFWPLGVARRERFLHHDRSE